MTASFHSFALGLSLSVVLLYLILVAQFRSFKDPLLIMLAIPMGFIGVLVILPLTATTLNVMSLMGVLMLVGIAASNSILIVEFAHRLEEQGKSVEDAVITSCRVRLRPILMTSFATIIGMVPMALKMGTGSEQYAPLARAIIGGLVGLRRPDGFHCSRGLLAGLWKSAAPGGRTVSGGQWRPRASARATRMARMAMAQPTCHGRPARAISMAKMAMAQGTTKGFCQ